MQFDCILCHYGEIALKGKNKCFFEKKLKENLCQILKISPKNIQIWNDRFVINFYDSSILEKLSFVFGLNSFSPAFSCQSNIKEIETKIINILKNQPFQFAKFKVATTRSDKKFPLTSLEANRHFGGLIKKLTQAQVDLENPEITFFLEITHSTTFIYFQKIKGPGGLPVGSQDKTLVLLSGGIDSPVAAYLLLKRGAEVNFIHFHSYPFVSIDSVEKVKKIVVSLLPYAIKTKLIVIPFGEIQKEILKKCSAKNRVLLYRRLMLRISEEVAKEEKILSLTTGENLGQVASQTMVNLAVLNEAVKILILRPLLGFDKEEIINLAKKINTYQISILPQDDCCSLFLPKFPATKAKLEEIKKEEKNLSIKSLVKKALKSKEVFKFYA